MQVASKADDSSADALEQFGDGQSLADFKSASATFFAKTGWRARLEGLLHNLLRPSNKDLGIIFDFEMRVISKY